MKKFFKGFAVFLLSLFLFSCSQGANTIAKKSSITFTLPTLSRSEGRVGDTLDEISQDIIPNEVPVEFEVKAYKISEEIIQAAIEWNNINKDNEKIRIDEPTIASEETDYNDAEIVSVEEEPEENKETDSIQDSLQYYFDCFIGDFSREKSSFEKECLHYFGEKCVKAKGKEGEPVTLRLEEGYYFVSVIGIQKNNEETCFIGFGTGKVDLENESTLRILAEYGNQFTTKDLWLSSYYTGPIIFENKGNTATAIMDVSDKYEYDDYGYRYSISLNFAENDLILVYFDDIYSNIAVENLNMKLVDEDGNLYAELAEESNKLAAGCLSDFGNRVTISLKAVKSSPYVDLFDDNPECHKYFLEMSYECEEGTEETLKLTKKYKCYNCEALYDSQEEADGCDEREGCPGYARIKYINLNSRNQDMTFSDENIVLEQENGQKMNTFANLLEISDIVPFKKGNIIKVTYNGYVSNDINQFYYAVITNEKGVASYSELKYIKLNQGNQKLNFDITITDDYDGNIPIYIFMGYVQGEGELTLYNSDWYQCETCYTWYQTESEAKDCKNTNDCPGWNNQTAEPVEIDNNVIDESAEIITLQTTDKTLNFNGSNDTYYVNIDISELGIESGSSVTFVLKGKRSNSWTNLFYELLPKSTNELSSTIWNHMLNIAPSTEEIEIYLPWNNVNENANTLQVCVQGNNVQNFAIQNYELRVIKYTPDTYEFYKKNDGVNGNRDNLDIDLPSEIQYLSNGNKVTLKLKFTLLRDVDKNFTIKLFDGSAEANYYSLLADGIEVPGGKTGDTIEINETFIVTNSSHQTSLSGGGVQKLKFEIFVPTDDLQEHFAVSNLSYEISVK